MLKRFPKPGRQIFLTLDQEKLERGEIYRNPAKYQSRAWELMQKYSKRLEICEKVVLSANEMICFLLYTLGNPASLETETSISKIESDYGAILRIQEDGKNSISPSLQRFCTDGKFFLLANSPSVKSKFVETLHFFFSQPDLLNFLDEIFNYYNINKPEDSESKIQQKDVHFIYLLSVALDYYKKYTDDSRSSSKIELSSEIQMQIRRIRMRLNFICSIFESVGFVIDTRPLIKEDIDFFYIRTDSLFSTSASNQVKTISEISVDKYEKNGLYSLSRDTITDLKSYKQYSQSQRDYTSQTDISANVAKGTAIYKALEEGTRKNSSQNLTLSSHQIKMQRAVIQEIETLHGLSVQKQVFIDPILIFQFISKNFSYLNINQLFKFKLSVLAGKIKIIIKDEKDKEEKRNYTRKN